MHGMSRWKKSNFNQTIEALLCTCKFQVSSKTLCYETFLRHWSIIYKADELVIPSSLLWHIFPDRPLPLFDPHAALISLLHTLCHSGNCLTLLVIGQWCATNSFPQGSRSTFALSCVNRVGDDGNNFVLVQTSSTANMMTLNSHCTVQYVEAIKLRLIFLRQWKGIIHQWSFYSLVTHGREFGYYFLKLVSNILWLSLGISLVVNRVRWNEMSATYYPVVLLKRLNFLGMCFIP